MSGKNFFYYYFRKNYNCCNENCVNKRVALISFLHCNLMTELYMLMSGNLTKIEMVTNEWEQKRKVKTDLLNYVRTIVLIPGFIYINCLHL